MNRLSLMSKEVILSELRVLFQTNGTQVKHFLLSYLLEVCRSQIMSATSLVLYAAMILALHVVISNEIGAYFVEEIVLEFMKQVHSDIQDDNDVLRKNFALLLSCLYNLDLYFSTLFCDIIKAIVNQDSNDKVIHIEVIRTFFQECGQKLKRDDPKNYSAVADDLKTKLRGDSRAVSSVIFILEEIQQPKKVRRDSHEKSVCDTVKPWLVSLERNYGLCSCLRVPLIDLMHSNQRGRWWITGASWLANPGNKVKNSDPVESLEATAQKLRFSTPLRKQIFSIIMTSRDVNSAYEKVARLNCTGKHWNDVAIVLLGCCTREKTYNSFYAEVALLLCQNYTDFTSALRYSLHDFLRSLGNSPSELEMRRKCDHISKFVVAMVEECCISLSVLKVIDLPFNREITVFLQELFIQLFSSRKVRSNYLMWNFSGFSR